MGQNQIQHPGRQSSLQCSPPMFQIRAKDSNSTPIAEENWNMFNNTLTLTFEGCDAIGVGNSTTIQFHSICNHCCQGEQIQTNSAYSGEVQTNQSGTKFLDGIIKKQTELLVTSDGKDIQEGEENGNKNLSEENGNKI